MNKLSKEKRDKLILTIIGIIGALGVLYTFVLGTQQDNLTTLQMQIMAAKDKVSKAEVLVKSEHIVTNNLAQSQKELEARLRDTAPDDAFYWLFRLLADFRKKHNLSPDFIIDMTQPEFVDLGLINKFPFKAASFGVRLNGRFQEAGRFISELENAYPYFRVQNVRIGTQSAGFGQLPQGGDSGEKLLIELRVVTLVKPVNT